MSSGCAKGTPSPLHCGRGRRQAEVAKYQCPADVPELNLPLPVKQRSAADLPKTLLTADAQSAPKILKCKSSPAIPSAPVRSGWPRLASMASPKSWGAVTPSRTPGRRQEKRRVTFGEAECLKFRVEVGGLVA